MHRYNAQGQFWFHALEIFMEFYSSGFSKVQQKQATKQYALSEPQEPFSGPSAYSFKISLLWVDCKENMHGNFFAW